MVVPAEHAHFASTHGEMLMVVMQEDTMAGESAAIKQIAKRRMIDSRLDAYGKFRLEWWEFVDDDAKNFFWKHVLRRKAHEAEEQAIWEKRTEEFMKNEQKRTAKHHP